MSKYFPRVIFILVSLSFHLAFGSESSCDQIIEREVIKGFKKNDLKTLPKGYSHDNTSKENMLQIHRDPVPDYDKERYSPGYLKEVEGKPVKVTKIWTKESGNKSNPRFKFYYATDGTLAGILANTADKLNPFGDKAYSSKFYTFDKDCNLSSVSWIDNKYWGNSDKIVYFSANKEICDGFKNYESIKQGPLKSTDIRLKIPFELACKDAGGTRDNFACMCDTGFSTNPGPYSSTCNPTKGQRGNSGPAFVKARCNFYSNMLVPEIGPTSKEPDSKDNPSTKQAH